MWYYFGGGSGSLFFHSFEGNVILKNCCVTSIFPSVVKNTTVVLLAAVYLKVCDFLNLF
jgi:hypothetical protein